MSVHTRLRRSWTDTTNISTFNILKQIQKELCGRQMSTPVLTKEVYAPVVLSGPARLLPGVTWQPFLSPISPNFYPSLSISTIIRRVSITVNPFWRFIIRTSDKKFLEISINFLANRSSGAPFLIFFFIRACFFYPSSHPPPENIRW